MTTLAIIADDITGATDVAGRVVREGTPVQLHLGLPTGTAAPTAPVVVIALPIRAGDPERARSLALSAAQLLLSHGETHLMYKVCSTFDSTAEGNIGPVLDALAERTGATRTPVCPASPEHGRTVYRSRLFVGDDLLEESPLKDHPVNPMRHSDLRVLLRMQSTTTVAQVQHEHVNEGFASVTRALAGPPGGTAHVVVDALDDDDLDVVAAVALDGPLSCGAAGLGAALARQLRAAPSEAARPAPAVGRGAVLSGSCSAASLRQVAAFAAVGPSILIDPRDIARGADVVADVLRLVERLAPGESPLVYSSVGPQAVAAAQRELGVRRAAQLTETALGQVAVALAERGFTHFVVGGGETSGAVAAALGATTLEVLPEIEPGVPWVRAHGARDLYLALKSGNFGSDDFYLRAIGWHG